MLAQVLILRFRLHGGLQLSSWGEGNGAAIPKTDGLHKTTLGDTRRELTKTLAGIAAAETAAETVELRRVCRSCRCLGLTKDQGLTKPSSTALKKPHRLGSFLYELIS